MEPLLNLALFRVPFSPPVCQEQVGGALVVIFSTYDFVVEHGRRRLVSSFKKHLKSSFAAFCSSPAAVVSLDFYWLPFQSVFEIRCGDIIIKNNMIIIIVRVIYIIYCTCSSNCKVILNAFL